MATKSKLPHDAAVATNYAKQIMSLNLHDLKMKHGISVNIIDGDKLVFDFPASFDKDFDVGIGHLLVALDKMEYTDTECATMLNTISETHNKLMVTRALADLVFTTREELCS